MTDTLTEPSPLDLLEQAMTRAPQARCPVVHRFTPGLYCREIFIPAGTLLTSAVHKTMHPFVISAGIIRVQEEGHEPVTYEAPYTGVTTPATRRLLYAVTDTIWTTFHPTTREPWELRELLADLVDDPQAFDEGFIPAYRTEENLQLPCSTSI
jgi:hypothetical protein